MQTVTYTECHIKKLLMLSVIMLNVVMLCVVAPFVVIGPLAIPRALLPFGLIAIWGIDFRLLVVAPFTLLPVKTIEINHREY